MVNPIFHYSLSVIVPRQFYACRVPAAMSTPPPALRRLRYFPRPSSHPQSAPLPETSYALVMQGQQFRTACPSWPEQGCLPAPSGAVLATIPVGSIMIQTSHSKMPRTKHDALSECTAASGRHDHATLWERADASVLCSGFWAKASRRRSTDRARAG